MKINNLNDNFVKNALSTTKNSEVEKSFESTYKKALEEKDDEKLKKVCDDFESVMLNIMYKQMKATVGDSKLIPKESGRDAFDSMLDDKLVEESSKKGDLGLGDLLYKQMKKNLANIYKKE